MKMQHGHSCVPSALTCLFRLPMLVALLLALGLGFLDPAALMQRSDMMLVHAQPPLVYLPPSATERGAVCLDGSAPAYSLDPGSGSGANKWIVHLQGGGWCWSTSDCLARSKTELGSSSFMYAFDLVGLLSASAAQNPDFYNWNRVLVRYCDGGSFQGDVDSPVQVTDSNGQAKALYFRGQRIFDAVVDDLLSKGLSSAQAALLSGNSAGGSAAFFHCNSFREKLATSTDVKCLSDAGFFVDIPNLTGVHSFRQLFQDVVELHNIPLPIACTSKLSLGECFFPHNNLGLVQVPLFFAQSAYDGFEVQYVLAPFGTYADGSWDACKASLWACSQEQLAIIQAELRGRTLSALQPLLGSQRWGMHVVSCYFHSEAVDANIWNGATQIDGKNLAQAVHSWYFEGSLVQLIDCPYPCNPTCVNP